MAGRELLFVFICAATWHLGSPMQCRKDGDFIKCDDWVLVYRVEADIGVSAYDTWLNDNIYHDSPVSSRYLNCVHLNQSCNSCNTHYKSKIVARWNRHLVQKVKVLLMKHGEVRAHVIFDGRGSSKTNWFSKNRIISSSWKDLKSSPANIVSIEGSHTLRRFMMNSVYNGCPNDIGWMFIIDGRRTDMCNWDRPVRFPKIIYSPKHHKVQTHHWLEDFEFGDTMAVLVSL